ncbi:MAG: cache domain-containing protein [Clostridiales bacterium]|nr:cache domain-containing protein [Clostridiales bacterium]
MRVSQKKILKNWIMMILAIIIGFSVIVVFIFSSDIEHTKGSSKRFDKYVRNRMESIVESEVNNRIDEIEYSLTKIDEDERALISNKINILEGILLNSDLTAIENPQLRKVEAIQYFEQVVSADSEYLYFVMSTDAYLLRSGTDDSIEGVSLMEAQDKDGTFFAREIALAKENPDGVFVTYYWPKVKDGEPLKKTSYCRYIPEFDFIIGTGSYEEDVEQRLKNETFERLQEYYEGTENYIFIVDYDGTALVSGSSENLNTDISGLIDVNGVNILEGFMNTLTNSEDGYFTYHYYKPNSDVISEKISYVKRLDQWNAYIGMGFHSDDIITEINDFTKEFNAHHIQDLVITITMLVITASIVFFLIRRGLILQGHFMKQEDVVFEQLFQLSNEGITIVTRKGKVVYNNPIITKMMGKDIENYLNAFGEFEFQKETDEIHSVKSPSGRVFFIEMIRKPMVYHGKDSCLYFMSDVTEQYLQTNELQHMALYDQLTELPNRRKLLNDLEDIYENQLLSVPIVVAMVDLDHFKHVNDTYGHDIGDQVLKLLGKCFKGRLRDGDEFYRYGGEEFVAILRNLSILDAQNVLNGIKESLDGLIKESLGFGITFSAGITLVNRERKDFIETSLKEADVLLYQAKQKGRNRIEFERDEKLFEEDQ